MKNAANRDICPTDLYAPLSIGVSVGVTALGIFVPFGSVHRRTGKRHLRFSVVQQELRSLLCRPRSVTGKEGQNFPKRGSAQTSGSNSGGSFNQALNGSTNILSASAKGDTVSAFRGRKAQQAQPVISA